MDPDESTLKAMIDLGVERNVLWGSDYPHSEGTFPHSLAQVTKDFAGIPGDLAYKLLRANAARLYNIAT